MSSQSFSYAPSTSGADAWNPRRTNSCPGSFLPLYENQSPRGRASRYNIYTTIASFITLVICFLCLWGAIALWVARHLSFSWRLMHRSILFHTERNGFYSHINNRQVNFWLAKSKLSTLTSSWLFTEESDIRRNLCGIDNQRIFREKLRTQEPRATGSW